MHTQKQDHIFIKEYETLQWQMASGHLSKLGLCNMQGLQICIKVGKFSIAKAAKMVI